jgi:hypothetical protein
MESREQDRVQLYDHSPISFDDVELNHMDNFTFYLTSSDN